MNWPKDFDKQINDAKETNEKLLDIIMFNRDDEIIDANLKDWSVEKITSTSIRVKLEFIKPIEVSTGDDPDYLFIQLNMSTIRDMNGARLPRSLLKVKELP